MVELQYTIHNIDIIDINNTKYNYDINTRYNIDDCIVTPLRGRQNNSIAYNINIRILTLIYNQYND